MVKDKVCVEFRNEDGSLNLDATGTQPELERCETEDELFNVFFREHPDAQTANHTELYSWLDSLGLKVRHKYW